MISILDAHSVMGTLECNEIGLSPNTNQSDEYNKTDTHLSDYLVF